MFEWAKHGCECVIQAHELADLDMDIKKVEAERQIHADAKATALLILQDLQEFQCEQMQEQMDGFKSFLTVQCNKGDLENLEMQETLTDYEGNRFFGSINEMKKSLLASRVK